MTSETDELDDEHEGRGGLEHIVWPPEMTGAAETYGVGGQRKRKCERCGVREEDGAISEVWSIDIVVCVGAAKRGSPAPAPAPVLQSEGALDDCGRPAPTYAQANGTRVRGTFLWWLRLNFAIFSCKIIVTLKSS